MYLFLLIILYAFIFLFWSVLIKLLSICFGFAFSWGIVIGMVLIDIFILSGLRKK